MRTRRDYFAQLLTGGGGLLGLSGLAGLLAGCGQTGSGTTNAVDGASGGGTKKEFVVAPPLTSLGDLVKTINRAQPMADFLAKDTGLPVRAFAPGDYAGTIIGLRDGSIDFGFLPAVLFLRAQSDSGAQPLFRTLRLGVDDKPTAAFTSVIAVRNDSGIGTLDAVKGKHVAATDVSDAAGWVFPAAQLKKNGIDPSREIKVEYRKDGPDALIQVL
ncbi:MAG TPA: PhnD/SsuA/transferrin family substrate-binding protein, partial [Chloroflexota bacterium]|nr:PhnD/SsuA/transferrin family substrate-binding protein [Chloroflexota bacterium]